MKVVTDKVYFCTGARNHDLLQFFDHDGIKFEYDERMASFKALGETKATGKPVSVCTTSGTAVANCVPAMLEAYYSENKLILITGDRPKKMHGTGAPQTIEHEALTRSCRRTFLEIDISELPHLDLKDMQYPVHINVLIDDTEAHDYGVTSHTALGAFGNFLQNYKKPLFIFSQEADSMRPLIEKFAERKLSFYAESLSCGRDLSFIKTEKKLIELFTAGFFDCVVRIGHTPLTKIWRLLEKKPLPVFHIDSRNLPGMSFGEVLPMSSKELMDSKEFWSIIDKVLPYPVADETLWGLQELIQKYPRSEIASFEKIQEKLLEDDLVYLGNSLVIRFFELTQKKKLTILGNRGVNGIDGQLATAIGVATGTKKQVFCILGDVTTFYDLASMRDIPDNLHLIIMNNGGGRIFDMLKLDKRIVLEHDHDFAKISEGLGLTYSNDLNDFGKVKVLELFPDREQSALMLKEWMK